MIPKIDSGTQMDYAEKCPTCDKITVKCAYCGAKCCFTKEHTEEDSIAQVNIDNPDENYTSMKGLVIACDDCYKLWIEQGRPGPVNE